MGIRVVRVGRDAASGRTLQRRMEVESIDAFLQEKSRSRRVVFLVSDEVLARLRERKEEFLDRGRKDRRKALSHYLLNKRERIPFISGCCTEGYGYSHTGQLGRSADQLLKKARESGEANVYVIGIDSKMFEQVWGQGERRPGPSRLTKRRAGRPFPATDVRSRYLDTVGLRDLPGWLVEQYAGDSLDIVFARQMMVRAADAESVSGKGERKPAPVLILGDTGTGKSKVARLIHKISDRRDKPFLECNCGAIPLDLLESELFGHLKGTFTGAVADKVGLWQQAEKGTLFLDEVGDLALEHQVKILRALEAGRIRPVGGRESKVDVRVIAATNRDLRRMVELGRFREDLFYRLRQFLIVTPPLRQHAEDIPQMAQTFWCRLTGEEGVQLPREIVAELKHLAWPGNVRELKTVLANLYDLFGRDVGIQNLKVEHLKLALELGDQYRAGEAEPGKTASGDEVRQYRLECLRHLRKVDEVVRACKVTLRPLARGKEMDASSMERLREAVAQRLRELDLLCMHPLLFQSEAIFSAAYRLKGKLLYLEDLLKNNGKNAIEYWEKELAPAIRQADPAVYDKVEQLLSQL